MDAQQLKEKNYDILKDYYGIKYYRHNAEMMGNSESDFEEFVGCRFAPEVYLNGYLSFGPEHYMKIIRKLGELFSDSQYAQKIFNQPSVASILAEDLFIASKKTNGNDRNVVRVSFRLDPTKTKRGLTLDFMTHRVNAETVLRCYRPFTEANIELSYAARIPIPGTLTTREEYEKAKRETFYKYCYPVLIKTVLEIKVNDAEAYYPDWESGSSSTASDGGNGPVNSSPEISPMETGKTITGQNSDIIILTDGSEIEAKVMEIGETEIKYKRMDNLDGPSYIMNTGRIFMIKFKNGTKELFHESSESNQETKKMSGEIQVERKTEVPDEILYISEDMPRFNGGDPATEFRKYIRSNLIYPEQAKIAKIEGRVIVQFVVNTQGWVQDVVVVRSIHPDLDQEAIRLVTDSPRWTPGKNHGKEVCVYFTYPINFNL